MSDIDFDELDRAVNSLMRPESQSATAAVEVNDVSAATDNNAPQAPEASAVQASSVATEQPSLAIKRRGQFMDVMHPSADMTAQSKPSVQPAKVMPSRRGVSLQPTSAVIPEPLTVPEAIDNVGVVDDTTDTIDSMAWSDPADSAEGHASSQPLDSDGDGASGIDTAVEPTTTEPTVTSPVEIDHTANSPFLPDAKVEKRPLGAADAMSALPDEPELATAAQSVVEQPGGEHELPAVSLPKELDASLVSIENYEAPDADMQTSGAVVEPASEVVNSAPQPSQAELAPVATVLASPSVPPQVQVSASSALPSRTPTMAVDTDVEDDTHASIFDTSEHGEHQRHAKHSSGWYTVLIFAGMVAIGVLGAVVYYFVTNGI